MAFSRSRNFCFNFFGCCSGKGDKVTKRKTVEAGEEAVESSPSEKQEVPAVVNQPATREEAVLTAETQTNQSQSKNPTSPDTAPSGGNTEESNFRAREQEVCTSEIQRQESSTSIPEVVREPPKFQADTEYLTESYSAAEELVCLVSSPTECLAPSRASGSRPQSIHIEEESVCQAPAEEKVKLLKALNLKLIQMMETVDTLVVNQQGTAKATEEEPSLETAEALSSLIDQSEGARETTPETDNGSGSGSMHTSTGSEGLEEEDKEKLVNGDKPSEVDPEVEKAEQKASKETQKEEKATKSKKKEDKTIEHILRALSSLHSTEEKLAALCKKYADLHEEHRIVQSTLKQTQRKLTVVTREKDQLQTEHTKAVMAKSKLEGLCRELQKHNQVIRQESLQRAREEDEKRKEISNKFQTTISEIQQQMSEHHERNIKLREENQELAAKLKKFIEQYEVREKQVEKLMQHRELEQKLADAKLQQATTILTEEQERSKKEKELLLLQATEGQKKATLLEAQLGMYKERYEEFQSTISKSNDMFQKFKTEMDKMTKRIKKLERDGAAWKNKWENANKALLEMAEEKTLYDKEKPVLMNKIQKLESLCRAMQAERLGRKVMEASNIEVPKVNDNTEPDASQSPSDKALNPSVESKDSDKNKTQESVVEKDARESVETQNSSQSDQSKDSANLQTEETNQSQPSDPDEDDDDEGDENDDYVQDDDDEVDGDDDASPEDTEDVKAES